MASREPLSITILSDKYRGINMNYIDRQMKCELCDEEAYGMIDGLVAICWNCDTCCGSFEPSVEVVV